MVPPTLFNEQPDVKMTPLDQFEIFRKEARFSDQKEIAHKHADFKKQLL
jgi:hypothetical protein